MTIIGIPLAVAVFELHPQLLLLGYVVRRLQSSDFASICF
jgi:uncharacterized membrane protein YccF (DUF307 family)